MAVVVSNYFCKCCSNNIERTLLLIISGGGDWSTEGTGIGGISGGTTTTTTTTTTKPPVPSSGFLTGDQDWNVGPTTTTKDWGADDAGGDWGNTDSSQVTTINNESILFFFLFRFLGYTWKLVVFRIEFNLVFFLYIFLLTIFISRSRIY